MEFDSDDDEYESNESDESDKDSLEESIREEYDEKLQEKDDTIRDLQNELGRSNRRQFEDFIKINNLQRNLNNYQNEANIRIRNLENQVDRYKINYNKFQDLKYENDDLLDENDYLNEQIKDLKYEKNNLRNRIDEYERVNEINNNNIMMINQKYNNLLQDNKIQESMIYNLQRELAQANQKNEELSNKINNLEKINTIQSINNYQQFNFNNNYYFNKNNSNEININFVSQDQTINTMISCLDNEIFSNVEERLIQQNPKIMGKKLLFLANGSKISKTKTVKENNITNGLKVVLIVIEKKYEGNSSNNNYNTYYNNEINDQYNFSNTQINNFDFQNNTTYIDTINSNLNIPTTTTIATNSNPYDYSVPTATYDTFQENNNNYPNTITNTVETTDFIPFGTKQTITTNTTQENNVYEATTKAIPSIEVGTLTTSPNQENNVYASTIENYSTSPISFVPEVITSPNQEIMLIVHQLQIIRQLKSVLFLKFIQFQLKKIMLILQQRQIIRQLQSVLSLKFLQFQLKKIMLIMHHLILRLKLVLFLKLV